MNPRAASITVVYDGECPFCRAAVEFAERRDPECRLRCVVSSSPEGESELAGGDAAVERTSGGAPRRLVAVEGGQVYTGSTAALRIAGHLKRPWRWLRIFLLLPRPVRDAVYDWVARHRHRLVASSAPPRVL